MGWSGRAPAPPAIVGATSAARTPTERSSIVHSSLYLPEPVYEALRKIAFDERAKIRDIVLRGSMPLCDGVGIHRLRASTTADSCIAANSISIQWPRYFCPRREMNPCSHALQ
jgi:hypothetical protein